jgi:hypothetical protein
MRSPIFVSGLVAAVFSTASFAQPASQQAQQPPRQENQKSSKAKQKQSAAAKANYSPDDCRKDLANAREAKQAGHVTDKELAEQKKMSQTKLKRDSGKGAEAAKTGECG